MGKKILVLGIIVCLAAGFAGCSRKFSAIWQWNSSKHNYYAFNVDEKGGFGVIYNNSIENQDNIYISRYDVNGNLAWDKKFEKGMLLNGIYIFIDKLSCTLIDYESGKKIANVEGELLPDNLDGKSLLFERGADTQKHTIVKTDLKGNRLWETSIPSDSSLYVHSCDEKLIYLDDYENYINESTYISSYESESYDISKNDSDSLINIDNVTGLPSIDSWQTYEKKTGITYNFYQLDLETGKLVKHTQLFSKDNVEITDLSDENWNLLVSKPGLIQMYNCIEGKVVWSTKLDVNGIVVVAPRDGIILVDLVSDDKNSTLACINFKTGREMWRKHVDRNTPVNASIIKDKIAIGIENIKESGIVTDSEGGNKILFCEIASGKTLWTKEGSLFNGDGSRTYFSPMPWNWKPELCITLNVELDKNDNNDDDPKSEYRYQTSYVDSALKDQTISGKFIAIVKNIDKQIIRVVVDTETGAEICQISNPIGDYLEYFNIDKDTIEIVTGSGMSKYSLATGKRLAQMKFDTNRIGMSGNRVYLSGVHKIDLTKDLNEQISNARSPFPTMKDGLVFIQGCKGLAIYDLKTFDEVYFSNGVIFNKFDVIKGDIYLFDSNSLTKLTR